MTFDNGFDYDLARDEEQVPSEEWTERDERILQEYWEMAQEDENKPDVVVVKPRCRNGSV